MSANHNTCCPFTSPSNADAGGYSPIYWNGSLNNGSFVDDTHYGYILRTCGCNNTFFDQAGMIGVYGSHARYSASDDQNQEIPVEGINYHSRGKPDSTISTLNTKEIVVYPNPFNDLFTIKLINFEADKALNFHYIVINAIGQTIEARRINSNEHMISSNNWPSSIYFCRVFNKNYAQTFKVIKQ